MIKIFYAAFIILAATFFIMTLLLSPDQEILFRWWPGQDPIQVSLGSLAFFYCGYGLFIAMVLGLLDRLALTVRLKRTEKEKHALQKHSSQLKTILAEDPSPATGSTQENDNSVEANQT